MHELTCTCHACLVIRAYLHAFNHGGPAGHPIACVCPQCAYARDLLRRFPLGLPLRTPEPASLGDAIGHERAAEVFAGSLLHQLGFTVREGDTR